MRGNLKQLLHLGMISGQLFNLPFPQPIDTAITNMSQCNDLAIDEHRHGRRGHTTEFTRGKNHTSKPTVAHSEAWPQSVHIHTLLGIKRNGPSLSGGHRHCRFDKSHNTFNHCLRGNRARNMPAHTVGNNKQPQVLADQQVSSLAEQRRPVSVAEAEVTCIGSYDAPMP